MFFHMFLISSMILWISKIKSLPSKKKVLKEALTQRTNKCRTDGTTAMKWRAERKEMYEWLFIVWMPWRYVLGIVGHPPILFPLPVHQDRNQDESQRAEAFVTCKTHSQSSKEYRRIVFFMKVDVRSLSLCCECHILYYYIIFNSYIQSMKTAHFASLHKYNHMWCNNKTR